MPTSRTAPIILCLLAAALWGLWWVPIRWLEGAGLTGGYAGFAMSLGALPVLLAATLLRKGGRCGAVALAGAVSAGLAVTLYGLALLYTDVVRCVLLFYLAPVWSTIFECVFMGRRWSWRSALAIGVSLIGAAFVFRGEVSLAALNIGDAMALAAGICWAVGAAIIFVREERNPQMLALVACLASLVFGGAYAFLAAPVPQAQVVADAALPALVSGALFLAPVLGVTLWAALNLPPATLSFLLTAEIISGVASSAVFLDERFGAPEMIGTVLIITGALIEVFAPAQTGEGRG